MFGGLCIGASLIHSSNWFKTSSSINTESEYFSPPWTVLCPTANISLTSLKYQLIDMTNEEVLCQGLVERIGIEGAVLTHKINGSKHVFEQDLFILMF